MGCDSFPTCSMKQTFPYTYAFLLLYRNQVDLCKRSSGELIQAMQSTSDSSLLGARKSEFYRSLYRFPYREIRTGPDRVLMPCAGIIENLARDGVRQSLIARWCGISAALVSNWKDGSKCPGKYPWWLLGLHLGVPVSLLEDYLLMAGHCFDPLCRQDQILLHGQVLGYSISTILEELEQYRSPILR